MTSAPISNRLTTLATRTWTSTMTMKMEAMTDESQGVRGQRQRRHPLRQRPRHQQQLLHLHQTPLTHQALREQPQRHHLRPLRFSDSQAKVNQTRNQCLRHPRRSQPPRQKNLWSHRWSLRQRRQPQLYPCTVPAPASGKAVSAWIKQKPLCSDRRMCFEDHPNQKNQSETQKQLYQ